MLVALQPARVWFTVCMLYLGVRCLFCALLAYRCPAPNRPRSSDPRVFSLSRTAGSARHEISSESSADSPDSRCHRAACAGSKTGDSHASGVPHAAGESDALGDSHASGDSESYEGLDSDGSVADLSAIIDAITRTYISDDAVIVTSDDGSHGDDADLIEVYED